MGERRESQVDEDKLCCLSFLLVFEDAHDFYKGGWRDYQAFMI